MRIRLCGADRAVQLAPAPSVWEARGGKFFKTGGIKKVYERTRRIAMKIRNDLIETIDNFYQLKNNNRGSGEQGGAASDSTREVKLSKDEINKMIDQLNISTRKSNERISFAYNEATNRIIVRVVNNDTNEVIREIPPKDFMRFIEHLKDSLGVLVDESR
jgi:flagellar protein FlaG